MVRPRSLQFKLSLLFVFLLLTVSLVDIFTVTSSTDRYLAEVTQKMNLDLAASIAHEMRIEQATNQIPVEKLKELFNAAMIINPNIKLYLLGLDGKLLASSADPGEIKLSRVSVGKVRALLDREQPLPIYGEDPRNPGKENIFSAALLSGQDGSPHCYLYIILGAGEKGTEALSVKHSYILRVLIRSFLIAAFVVLCTGLLMIFFLTRNLQKLSDAVRKVQKGDFSARVHIQTGDELNELADAFNEMAEKIELALQTLSKNDHLRRELVANISHDLRTPLASIEGYAETILLKEHLLSEQERKTYLQTILKNTKSLGRLVSELFDLSKLEAEQTVAQPEPFSLTELVQDILLKFEPQARQQQIELSGTLPRNIPFVLADLALIERALQNFIANALQYTPAEGKVWVKVEQTDELRVCIRVSDTGRGISTDDLPYIFDRFYRSGNVREKSRLGLGLAIARKIVEMHGSQVEVQSTENVGTVFTFSLPVLIRKKAEEKDTVV